MAPDLNEADPTARGAAVRDFGEEVRRFWFAAPYVIVCTMGPFGVTLLHGFFTGRDHATVALWIGAGATAWALYYFVVYPKSLVVYEHGLVRRSFDPEYIPFESVDRVVIGGILGGGTRRVHGVHVTYGPGGRKSLDILSGNTRKKTIREIADLVVKYGRLTVHPPRGDSFEASRYG
jgi:hypothetical protein